MKCAFDIWLGMLVADKLGINPERVTPAFLDELRRRSEPFGLQDLPQLRYAARGFTDEMLARPLPNND